MGKERLEHIANDPQQGFCSPLGRVERIFIPQTGHSVYEVNGTGYKEVRVCGRTYRVYPGSSIGATRDGKFINVETWKSITPKYHHNYVEVRDRRNGISRSMSGVRMMIELWKPEWKGARVIKRIDGDPLNISIDNLCIGENLTDMTREQKEYVERLNRTVDEDRRFVMTEDPNIWVSRRGEVMRRMELVCIDECNHSGRGTVLVGINGRVRTLSHVIYETFSGRSVESDECITYRDGNKMNLAYENLKIEKKFEGRGSPLRIKLQDEGLSREIERTVRETRLMVNWFATGKYDEYTEYLMNEVYPHLKEIGLKRARREVAEIGAREVVASVFLLISKRRVINNYYHVAEKMMYRWIKRRNTSVNEERLKEVYETENGDIFRKIAEKYGVDIIS